MTKEQRMASLILGPVSDIIRELALVHATNECDLGDDEIQEILYRLSPVVAIGRRFGQGRPIEAGEEREMDQVHALVQNLFFDALNEIEQEVKNG